LKECCLVGGGKRGKGGGGFDGIDVLFVKVLVQRGGCDCGNCGGLSTGGNGAGTIGGLQDL